MNPIILTHSGLHFNLLAPDPDLIEIEDIAHALSHLCRFTGHTRQLYSVAEHSVRVSRLVPPAYRLEALLHDAAEAYIGDVSSPLKALLPAYRGIEHNIDQAIRARFGLPLAQTHCVKHADLVMLATERRDLMSSDDTPWEMLQDIKPAPFQIFPTISSYARQAFLQCFADYQAAHHFHTSP